MKVQINAAELKREWVCDHWYEKVFYVTGLLTWIWMIVAILVGFIVGLVNS